MKVTNWCRKLRFTLVAAGVCIPGVAYAQNIPLLDSSFEAFTVPGAGFAYSDLYRPTSAWVDDQDNPAAGQVLDDGVSNWLYSATYAEIANYSRRAAPRTGVQAMHGLFNYSGQEVSTFEASKKYTFSVWAQNDEVLNETNGVFLYIYDGSQNFSDANALKSKLFTTEINTRQPGMTAVQSQANWSQITIEHVVLPGAPEIGKPIGVSFYGRKDSAVDDASLNAVVINPSDYAMYLEVNTTNGQVTMKNQTGAAVNIDYYQITSVNSSLHAVNWTGVQEQGNVPGFTPGNGTGNGWEAFGVGGLTSKIIGESDPVPGGFGAVIDNMSISLGAAYRLGMQHDLVFQYGLADTVQLDGDFNGDNKVDSADYVLWRKKGLPASDYTKWVNNYGRTAQPTFPSHLVRGYVQYVSSGSGGGVPEPSTVLLVGLGLASLSLGRRRNLDN